MSESDQKAVETKTGLDRQKTKKRSPVVLDTITTRFLLLFLFFLFIPLFSLIFFTVSLLKAHVDEVATGQILLSDKVVQNKLLQQQEALVLRGETIVQGLRQGDPLSHFCHVTKDETCLILHGARQTLQYPERTASQGSVISQDTLMLLGQRLKGSEESPFLRVWTDKLFEFVTVPLRESATGDVLVLGQAVDQGFLDDIYRENPSLSTKIWLLKEPLDAAHPQRLQIRQPDASREATPDKQWTVLLQSLDDLPKELAANWSDTRQVPYKVFQRFLYDARNQKIARVVHVLPLENQQLILGSYYYGIYFTVLISLLLAVFLAMILARNITQPLLKLIQQADSYYNMGNAYLKLEQPLQAEACYRAALQRDPANALYWNNLGLARKCQGKIPEAGENYRAALQYDPDFPDAHYNLSVIQLLQGQFKEAWCHYEWRNHKKTYAFARHQKRWTGDRFDGQTLFIQAEGGFGDTLQFIRYLPQAKALGGKVILEVQHGLKSLLEGFPGVDQLIESPYRNEAEITATTHQDLEFNQFTGLMSLPALFNCTPETIPKKFPYIQANGDKVQAWKTKIEALSSYASFKIGIVWSGSVTQPTLLRRSCALTHFYPLAALPGVQLFSLNKWAKPEELQQAEASGIKIINLAEDLQDFSDAAAAVENMDLILSVDTGIVHLAGAMMKPVWTLLPAISDWRWMENRCDTPWYPTMRLFRQTTLSNWDSVFQEVLANIGRS